MNAREQALAWVKQFEAGKRWLDKVKMEKTGSINTQQEYAYRLQKFCQWTNKTPDQLIAERKEQLKPSSSDKEETKTDDLITDFFNHLEGSQKDPVERAKKRTSAKSYYGAIRSFFKYNSTAKTPIKLTGQTPRGHAGRNIKPITMEELKRLDAIANPRDRALLRFTKDSGCSGGDIVVFNYGDIRGQFERGDQFIHLNAVRGKEQINYETFIGPNTVEALKVYFDLRKQHGEKFTDATPLFVTEASKRDIEGEPSPRERLDVSSVRTIFARFKSQSGIIVSPHRVRKLFDTQMAAAHVADSVRKYWMGHSMGGGDIENIYVIPPLDDQWTEYRNAYRFIDLQPKADEKEVQMQNMINSARLMGATPEKIEELKRILAREKSLTVEDFAKMIREELQPKTDDCNDGKHCQRIVSENELPELLTAGWRVVSVLQSGKVVVSNET